MQIRKKKNPPLFEMQSTNTTFVTGVISSLREFPSLSFSKCKLQMRHYLLGLIHGFENTRFSKCKVQMWHYSLGLLYALDKTLSFPNRKCKCDIIYWGYLFLYREYPLFRNANYKCDIVYWGYFMLLRIHPYFQMQSTNATLFGGVIICFREYPTFFPNVKYKCNIME